MSKSRGKKILLVILVALALFVVLFVISCKTNLTRLEAELEEVEDMYFQAGYTDYRINSVILSAYTFGEWDALYADLGRFISIVVVIRPIDRFYLKFSTDEHIKKYREYL